MFDARVLFSTGWAAACAQLGGGLLTNRGKLGSGRIAPDDFYSFCHRLGYRLWHSLVVGFKHAALLFMPVATEFYPLSPGPMTITMVFSKRR